MSQEKASIDINPTNYLKESAQYADLDMLRGVIELWKSNLPDLYHVVENTISSCDFDDRHENVILEAARLAAEPNKNPFHNNFHFLEVFSICFFLGTYSVNNQDWN